MRHKIDLNSYKPEIIENPNGLKVIYDPIRRKLIQYTPEENIRQKIIQFLIDKMEVPASSIEVEVPMARYVKGNKERADIIVFFDLREIDGEGKEIPVLSIECKSNEAGLSELTFLQVYKYNDILDIWVTAICNEFEIEFRAWSAEEEMYCSVLKIPSYYDLCDNLGLSKSLSSISYFSFPKFSYLYPPEEIKRCEEGIFVSAKSSLDVKQFSISFLSYIFNEIELSVLDVGEFYGIKMLEDKGAKYTSFGNSSGGSWTGTYRSFLVQRANEKVKLVNISIMSCLGGYTVLIVAIEDEYRSHNSLQLNLDRCLRNSGNGQIEILHDGKISVANIGAFPNREVISFIQDKCAQLPIVDGRLILGKIDNTKPCFDQIDAVQSLIKNLITYGILRDDFRNMKTNKKKG